MSRTGKKRLAIDIPVQMHNELKSLARKRNVTITFYVLRLLEPVIHREKKYDEPAKRMDCGICGQDVSNQTVIIGESIDDVTCTYCYKQP